MQSTKQHVLAVNTQYKGQLSNLTPILNKASCFAFYNTSLYDFDRLLADVSNLAANMKAYINGFIDNMREVLEKFDFNNILDKLQEKELLFLVMS